MNTTNSQKQLYGLLGYPLIHSFSKTFLNEKFIAENIPAEYINFEIDKIELIKKVIVENPELMGLNVTLPYKEAVIPYMNEMDETARMIGAVNVIKFIREKGKLKLKGFNSDIIGFTDSIRPLLNSEQYLIILNLIVKHLEEKQKNLSLFCIKTLEILLKKRCSYIRRSHSRNYV